MSAFSDRLGRWIGRLLSALLAVLVLLSAGDAVAWVGARSDARVAEVQGLLMIWFGLLAAAYGVRMGLHLGVEVLTRRLPAGLRRVLDRLVGLAVGVFGGLLTVTSWRLAQTVTNTLPATGWRASVQYFPATVAGILIAFFALEQTFSGERAPRPRPLPPSLERGRSLPPSPGPTGGGDDG